MASIAAASLDLFHELGESDVLSAMESRLEPHFGERTVDEVAQRDQVAPEDRARTAADPDRPVFRTSKASIALETGSGARGRRSPGARFRGPRAIGRAGGRTR